MARNLTAQEMSVTTADHVDDHDDHDDHAGVYPLWEPTDWTPRQRMAAISALLLLALACGLIAGAFGRWGIGPLALETFIPLGMTLLCLGALLLSYVFAYRYWHSSAHSSDHTPAALAGFLALAACVGVATLVFQVIDTALVVGAGWHGWRGYSPIFAVMAGALMVFFAILFSMGTARVTWRPRRDPARTDQALSAPVVGVRLALRWLLMLLAQNSWLLIGAPLWVFTVLETQHQPTVGTPPIPPPPPPPPPPPLGLWALVVGIAGVCFLLAALTEWTHRGATPRPAPMTP